MYMPKRKVFRDGEKLLMLMWLHYELFEDSFEQYKEKFNFKLPPKKDPNQRWLLVEVDPGMWVDFYEVEGKIVPGFKVILYGVTYWMPNKKLLKSILDNYQIEAAIKIFQSLNRKH